MITAVDEAIAEAPSCGNSREAIERVRALGLTKTADLLRLARDTMAGLATARAAGRTGGRRPKLTERQVALARQMHDSAEHTITAIAEVAAYRALGPRPR